MRQRADQQPPPMLPERALVHPLWIAALVVLVLNDHLLKGSGLLPAAFTGKLSDFAGLLVAPVLLAALCRATTRQGIAAAHGLVGLVFAAINIWPAAARGFEALTALTPLPWSIVVDPMDLIALPMLGISWALYIPRMTRSLQVPRWIAIPVMGLGALACMATSPPDEPLPIEPPIDEPFFADTWGNLAIANAREETVTLRVRRLRNTTFMDCAFVANSPTGSLSRALFGPAEFWEVEPNRAFALESTRGWENPGACDAFLVDGAGLSMQLIFFDVETYPSTWLPSTVDAALEARTVFIDPDLPSFRSHPAVFTGPPLIAPEPSTSCEMASEELSIAWSELPAKGTYTLEGLLEAPDGCLALSLSGNITWYLCLPRGTFPFQPGEEFFLDTLDLGEDFGSINGVQLLGAVTKLRAARGQDFVPFNASTTLSVEPAEGCGYVHDDCGNLTRPLVARYGGTSGVLASPGEAIMLGSQSYIYVVRAHDLPVGDSACLEDAIQSDRLIESVYVSY